MARKGYSCSNAGQVESGAEHHIGQQLHTPRPGADGGGGGGEGCVQGGGPVDALQVLGILNLFMVTTKDRQRMAAVTSVVQQFDPVSQFWVGE